MLWKTKQVGKEVTILIKWLERASLTYELRFEVYKGSSPEDFWEKTALGSLSKTALAPRQECSSYV